ncbi:hypothetical protein E2C01_042097 [Portunus trituberculatus]|uniref:Uncharacterized protein n=1 Tax=Portunus trituberculatus TaxID=210409 RepID=A0A5B7FSS1_PORTR|nr:hypothetical protein [Portunus trituberculatus]
MPGTALLSTRKASLTPR